MALFNKFFQSSKRKASSCGESKRQHEGIFPFSGEQVRVLLFRECDWTGRRLLFDSCAVQKVTLPTSKQTTTNQNGKLPNGNEKDESKYQHAFIEICNGYGYTYDHTICASNDISEMIFGSVAMSFKGTSLKVHWLREPTRIMCSQVFLSPINSKFNSFYRRSSDVKMAKSTNCDSESTNSISLSMSLCMTDKTDEKNQLSSSIPLNVPSSLNRNSFAFSGGYDSGFSSNGLWPAISCSSDRSSVASMFTNETSQLSSRKLSIDSAILVDAALNGRSSDGCLQRRIQRNMSTSFENNLSRNDFIGYFDENRSNRMISSAPNSMKSMVRRHSDQCESKSNPELIRKRKNNGKESLKSPHLHFSSCSLQTKVKHRRSKIGLAVCIKFEESIEDEMQIFCSEHIVLLESMLCRLRAAAETAYINQKKFHQLMLHAWFATTTWITDLFTAPRIPEPIWFTLNSTHSNQPQYLAKHFMTELCWLLNSADTKATNFFISTLVTAILTNHLGWVATVAPIANTSSDQVITIHQNQAKMCEISKFHPYNVLWAQLGDLYGSIGNPPRLAKTIVCGAHTVIINKVLSVLTYFVRCGEIQRVNSTKVLDKCEIEDTISGKGRQMNMSIPNIEIQQNYVEVVEHQVMDNQVIDSQVDKGLSRSVTCLKNIATICHEDELMLQEGDRFQEEFKTTNSTQKLNAFKDCMENVLKNSQNGSTIRLMIRNPNNDRLEYETASEAIDFILKKIESTSDEVESTPIDGLVIKTKGTDESRTKDNGESKTINIEEVKTKRLPWFIDNVKEGIIIQKWKSFGVDEMDCVHKNSDLKRSQSVRTKEKITNSLRKSKTVYGMTPSDGHSSYINVNVTNNNKNNLDSLASLLQEVKLNEDREKNVQKLKSTASVVFVLGDNEVLSGFKTPPPSPISSYERHEHNSVETTEQMNISASAPVQFDKSCESENTTRINDHTTITVNSTEQETKKKRCTHKKHSGVKFNFEQYPQIVTNYMKNKNLDITNYDFFEKGLKLDQETGASSTSFLPMFVPQASHQHDEHDDEEEQCECCANTFRILQTPSNATELEFSNDDAVYPVPLVKPTVNKLDTVIEHENALIESQTERSQTQVEEINVENEKKINEICENNENSMKTNDSNGLELIKLPLPKVEILTDPKRCIRPGYVPSLFVGVTDHFIPDMVLQGITTTTSPNNKWEPILKENLTLASHCATFEQIRTENVAIIANIDKWDVKLVSSQSCAMSSNGPGEPIGMSQLVSTMLETVQTMYSAGTSAYQCMSFLESKLKEIYLQSETLAAFLLATEFCSLNTVTKALNLSANDVPLLLSVASIHSPQVTKKYGISFR